MDLINTTKPRIVIVGGGFAGAYAAQHLERMLKPNEAEVVLFDRNNFFVFYPLLVEAGTGSLEPRHAVVSIRAFLGRSRFVMAEVTGFDPERRTLSYRLPDTDATEEMEFDHLVVTPGSVTRLPDVPGLVEHGFEIKSLTDAVRLRDHAIHQLELADSVTDPEVRRELLHFVVVGANFTGVEVAGEFDVFLKRACAHYRRVTPEDVKITLVELGQRILPALDEDLARYAAERMRRRGLEIELGTSVVSVEPNRAHLADGRTLATRTVIWCAGIAPPPLIAQLPVPTDTRGYIVCDRDLQVRGLDRVWAIGDAAVNADAEGAAYPATAQHAVRQARHLARNLTRTLRGQSTQPCNITSQGAIAALGCRTGVAKVFGVKLSGFTAWFLWRTVYLLKMPGWARRLRIALDWSMDLLFPRDPVQLGLTQARQRRATRANQASQRATG